ncbi:hypothetical protein MKX03_024834 [Papaver bracteatum]|nr:hypothetical protein MKX03_024834 [Papaver bracteatum]
MTEIDEGNSELDNFLMEFYIPDYILIGEGDSETEIASHIPVCPVIVFINSRSGGQLGGDFLITYRSLLNKHQVFYLGEEAPDKVLCRLYARLEKLKLCGDGFAAVAGGDGTTGWLLGVVCDLKLSHPPPIATVPLGTGNNLPFSFRWGKKNPGTDSQSVKSFLEQVMKAKEMKIDKMRAPKEVTCDPIAPLELPYSMHAVQPVQRVSQSDSENMEGYHAFRGGFWNYFSMGK